LAGVASTVICVVARSNRAAKGAPGATPSGAVKAAAAVQAGASALAAPDTRSDVAVATPAQIFVKADMQNRPSSNEIPCRWALCPIGKKVCQIN
jgi:hypothetical protein